MQIDEQKLSNMMDGEIGGGDEIGGIAGHADTRAAWARYHLIGDVVRDNASAVAPTNFAAEVADRIANEPAILAPHRPAKSVLKPVAGLAIAASVAALAVIGVQQMTPQSGSAAAPSVATLSVPADAAPVALAAAPVVTTLDAETARPDVLPIQRRLNGYLVKFNEQRSNVGVPGVNPYVRIVGFESE